MKYFKSVIALTAICAVISILLAITNLITGPIIEKNASAAANEALRQVDDASASAMSKLTGGLGGMPGMF